MRAARVLTSGCRRGTQPASTPYSSGLSAILVLNPSSRSMPGESVSPSRGSGEAKGKRGVRASPAGGYAATSSGPPPADAPAAAPPGRARGPARARAGQGPARERALRHCAGRRQRTLRADPAAGAGPSRARGALSAVLLSGLGGKPRGSAGTHPHRSRAEQPTPAGCYRAPGPPGGSSETGAEPATGSR